MGWAKAMDESQLQTLSPLGKFSATKLVKLIRSGLPIGYQGAKEIADTHLELAAFLGKPAGQLVDKYNSLSEEVRLQFARLQVDPKAEAPVAQRRPVDQLPDAARPEIRQYKQPEGDFRWDYSRPVIGPDGKQKVENGVAQFKKEMIGNEPLTVKYIRDKEGNVQRTEVYAGKHYIGKENERLDLLRNNVGRVTYQRTEWETRNSSFRFASIDPREKEGGYQPVVDEDGDVVGYEQKVAGHKRTYDLEGKQLGSLLLKDNSSFDIFDYVDPIDFAGPGLIVGATKVFVLGAGRIMLADAISLMLRKGTTAVVTEGAEVAGRKILAAGAQEAGKVLSQQAGKVGEGVIAKEGEKLAVAGGERALASLGGPVGSRPIVIDRAQLARDIGKAFQQELQAFKSAAALRNPETWPGVVKNSIEAMDANVTKARGAVNQLIARGDIEAANHMNAAAREGKKALEEMRGLAAKPASVARPRSQLPPVSPAARALHEMPMRINAVEHARQQLAAAVARGAPPQEIAALTHILTEYQCKLDLTQAIRRGAPLDEITAIVKKEADSLEQAVSTRLTALRTSLAEAKAAGSGASPEAIRELEGTIGRLEARKPTDIAAEAARHHALAQGGGQNLSDQELEAQLDAEWAYLN